jgi:hypothetical protein
MLYGRRLGSCCVVVHVMAFKATGKSSDTLSASSTLVSYRPKYLKPYLVSKKKS